MTRWFKGFIVIIFVCLLVSLSPAAALAASGEAETAKASISPQAIIVTPETTANGNVPASLAKLQSQNRILGHIYAAFTYNFWNLANGNSTKNVNALHIALSNVSGAIPIIWSGTSFSGTGTSTNNKTSISGTVSNDGTTLVSLTYSREYLANNGEFTTQESERIVLGGQFPILGGDGKPSNRVDGPSASKYVTSISHAQTVTQNKQKVETWEYRSADWSGTNCGVTLTFSYEYVPGETTTNPATTTLKTTTTVKPTATATPKTVTTTASKTTANDAYEPKISGINGQVEILLPGAKEWDFADLSSDLPPGTHIKTGIDSTCVLSFGDMSTFVLKPEAEVIVSNKPGANSIKTFKGDVWANFKKMITDGTMDVEMQQAVTGIKGTTFVCEEKQGISTVKVIEGTVQVKDKKSASYVILEDGEFITVSSVSGMGTIKDFDAAGEAALWKDIRVKTESAKAASSPGTKSSFPLVPVAVGAGVVVLLVIIIAIARRKK